MPTPARSARSWLKLQPCLHLWEAHWLSHSSRALQLWTPPTVSTPREWGCRQDHICPLTQWSSMVDLDSILHTPQVMAQTTLVSLDWLYAAKLSPHPGFVQWSWSFSIQLLCTFQAGSEARWLGQSVLVSFCPALKRLLFSPLSLWSSPSIPADLPVGEGGSQGEGPFPFLEDGESCLLHFILTPDLFAPYNNEWILWWSWQLILSFIGCTLQESRLLQLLEGTCAGTSSRETWRLSGGE